MPRGPRVAFENSYFHVFNRGVAKQRIFYSAADYKFFLTKLSQLKTKKAYDHTIFAYTLMPNHFHLLLRVRQTPLAKIMASLMTSYSMYINRTYDRVGGLFQNRFKSKLVDRDSYFLGASRYIHLNCIEAGLAKKLSDYPWSSYQEFFGNSEYTIIDKREAERMIGVTAKSRTEYQRFLLDGIKQIEKLHTTYGFGNDMEIVGGAHFTTLTQKKYLRRQSKLKVKKTT